MKNKKLTLFILLFIQVLAFAQVKLSTNFKVAVGKPYPVIDAAGKEYFGDGKGHTIAIKTDGEKVTIQLYDIVTMKEIGRKVYEDFPPYNKLQRIVKLGDKLFYIFSSFNKKEKVETLYSREVNMNDGTFEKPKSLFTTKDEVTVIAYGDIPVNMLGFGVPIRFEVLKSFDNSKILIRYRLKPESRNDATNYDILGFYVFNANFDKQWGGEVKMPYTEKEMNNLAYGVSKDGKAFMLAYINNSKHFELFNIGSDLKVKKNKIDINGKLVFQELFLRETADGNLTCLGYYANGIDVHYVFGADNLMASFNINGILDFKMDQNGKLIDKHDFEFPLELINQYESKRAKDKNEKREGDGKAGIRDLKVIDIGLNPDGSTTVIGEQQYITTEWKGTQQKRAWYYADIIATKYDKDGKLLWMKKLPKTQVGYMGKGGMSIRYIKGADAGYILYLDNVKNAKMSLTDVPEKHEDAHGGYLTAYKLDDATGAIEKHSIFDIKNIKGTEAFQFRTPRIFDAQEKVFMLEIYIKGKEDAMVKMELLK